jgi:hypothetical protein
MKVKILKTGEIKEVNDSFGARLVEQGQAIVVPATQAKTTTTVKKTGKGE